MDTEYKQSNSQASLFTESDVISSDKPYILSIGYEKRKTDSFLETLRKNNIQAVIDVRQSAFSRRLDFRKNRLIFLLEECGIEYFHMRNAGNPHRKVTKDLKKCLQMYYDFISEESSLIKEISSELNRISRTYPRMAMLCYEKCPSECHRTILINVLKENDFECSVIEV